MRVLIDTDIDPSLIRLTVYSNSEYDLVAVTLTLQQVLMNLAGFQYYKRRDYELVGYENQKVAIERWGWMTSSNSPTRAIPRRDELPSIELRHQPPPEELPLPNKCIQCILDQEEEKDAAPRLCIHESDPRLKLPG